MDSVWSHYISVLVMCPGRVGHDICPPISFKMVFSYNFTVLEDEEIVRINFTLCGALLMGCDVSVYEIPLCITSSSYKYTSTLCWQSRRNQPDLIFIANKPLDETLGHFFARFLSLTHSNYFLNPSTSLRFSPPKFQETGFKAISGGSISTNNSLQQTFTPYIVLLPTSLPLSSLLLFLRLFGARTSSL
ncbi:hypothetical protein VNO78_12516 [Psophocarpus tetragonolobus]|uniref:Uncharacterized protein n=1 Tax=Psophocarpus tetragonolobus TaxID=3891 RepID=A0AAN9SN53_PSOTE